MDGHGAVVPPSPNLVGGCFKHFSTNNMDNNENTLDAARQRGPISSNLADDISVYNAQRLRKSDVISHIIPAKN